MTIPAHTSVGRTAISKQGNSNLFTHVAIWLADGRVLGREHLRLESIQGREGVSQSFEFQLELRANTNPDDGDPLDFDQIIARPITFGVSLPTAGNNGDFLFDQALTGNAVEELSLFNGMIASFSLAEPGVYRATVRPDLWKLSLTNQYRLYGLQTIRGVIETLLREHAVRFDTQSLSPDSNLALNRVQDWLQAGESDLELITRLMEKAHLYYYFVHTGNSHTLVLANAPKYPMMLGGRPLRYTQTSSAPLGGQQFDVITQYQYQKTLASSSVQAVFSTAQVASQQDSVAGYTSYKPGSSPSKGKLPFNLYRVYSYGGGTAEVDAHAKEQAQMLDTSRSSLSGTSQCALMRVCHQFEMAMEQDARNVPELVRPSLDGKRFVLTSVQHQCSLDGGYSNQFQATEASPDTLVTPFELRNTHQGSILARVVAHDSGVPPRDWRYYDKTNFSPNLNTYTNYLPPTQTQEFQGVYVVFSTDLAGTAVWVRLASHMQVIPEINAMVWVSRANDNGEIPEIQSIVQNNGTMTVTPSHWMANTHVGNNYSTSYSDSKSIRFPYSLGVDLAPAVAMVEDRYSKGSQLSSKFEGAQQFRDVSYSIGGGFGYSAASHGRGDILNEGHSIGCTYNKSDGEETKSWTTYDLAWSESNHQVVESYQTISDRQYSKSTIGNTESHTHIKGSSTSYQTMDGPVLSFSTHNNLLNSTSLFNGPVTSETTHNMPVGSVTVYNVTAPVMSNTAYFAPVTNTALHNALVTSTTTHNGAVVSNTTHNGSVSSTTTINGVQNSVSTITTSSSTSTVGTSNSTSIVGNSASNNMIGSSDNTHVIGMSTNSSITAKSDNTSMVGVSTDMNMIGSTNSLSMIGSKAGLSVVGVSTELSSIGSVESISAIGTNNTVTSIGGGLLVNMDPRVQSAVTGLRAEILTALKAII